jgi:outer membrane protein
MALSSLKIPLVKMKMRIPRPEKRGLKALFLAGAVTAFCCSSAVGQEQGESLVLSPSQAVAFALDRNLALIGARLGPQAAALDVSAANAAWSPRLSSDTGVADGRTPSLTVFSPPAGLVSTQIASGAAITQALPWGSSYSVEWDAGRQVGNSPVALLNPQLTTAATLSFTQRLLRGLTIDEARANRLISLKGLTVSEAELASTVAATTHSVLRAYWAWFYARDYLAVERKSLELAQTLLRDDRDRAALGKIAAVDVVEAEAEVARRSDVIVSATKDLANAEDQLRLLTFGPRDPEQSRPLVPPAEVDDSDVPVNDAGDTIARAFDSRQDLRVLRAYLDVDDVTVRRLRNERLPEAALRVSYTGQGVSGSGVPSPLGNAVPIVGARGFSSALGDLAALRYSGWATDLSISVPIGHSPAAAEAAKAAVKRAQDETTLQYAEQRVATEVRSVVRDVEANRQRLPLTANAVALAERRLDAEQRKFLVGLSTSFLVFQAQRDLTASRESQLKSALDYRLSLADLQAVRHIPVLR